VPAATARSRARGRGLGVGTLRGHLQEQLLVDLARLALGGYHEQLAGHVHECTQVALGVIAQRCDQFFGHQLGGPGLGIACLRQSCSTPERRKRVAERRSS
jgi:hypothetical protein